MKILVVEDEVKAAAYLRKGLTEEGYQVEVAHTGVDGLHMASVNFLASFAQLTKVCLKDA